MTVLDQRDLAVIRFVAEFGQVTTKQIQQRLFYTQTSHTPAYRTLHRLADSSYLASIERRLVGGSKGGAGQFCWQLGRAGHSLVYGGHYVPQRVVRHHSLAIADVYLTMLELERAAKLRIRGYTTEPDCHTAISTYVLKPDLYADLERVDGTRQLEVQFEIDMGTQGQRQITDKFVRYWRAWEKATPEEWPSNRVVMFVAVDDERAEQLHWLLAKGKDEQRQLFRIRTLANLGEWLKSYAQL